jgi:hypothetical protein
MSGLTIGSIFSSGTDLSRTSSSPAFVLRIGTNRLLICSSSCVTSMMSYEFWYSPLTIVAGTPLHVPIDVAVPVTLEPEDDVVRLDQVEELLLVVGLHGLAADPVVEADDDGFSRCRPSSDRRRAS